MVVANAWWSWWLPTTPKGEIVVPSRVCVVVVGTNVVAMLWVGTNHWSVKNQNQLILWKADIWKVDLLKGWWIVIEKFDFLLNWDWFLKGWVVLIWCLENHWRVYQRMLQIWICFLKEIKVMVRLIKKNISF